MITTHLNCTLRSNPSEWHTNEWSLLWNANHGNQYQCLGTKTIMYPFDTKSSVTFSPYFGRQSYGFCTFYPTSHTHHRRPGFFFGMSWEGCLGCGYFSVKTWKVRRIKTVGHSSHLYWPDVSPSSKQYTHFPICCECWLITLSCPLLEELQAQQEPPC